MSQLDFNNDLSDNNIASGLGISQERQEYIQKHWDKYFDEHNPVSFVEKGIRVAVNSGEMLQAFVKPAGTKQEFAYCAFHAGRKAEQLSNLGDHLKLKIIKSIMKMDSDDGSVDGIDGIDLSKILN